jgi:3-mercaptopropionate dioxygenase
VPAGLARLISRIDEAIGLQDPDAITARIKSDLEEAIRSNTVELAERFRRVRPDGYARRLLHRNDALGYTAVVTWGPRQRTPLHDHAGIWCVEGVIEGRMDVLQFDLVDDEDTGDRHHYRFEPRGCIQAAVGATGCLIPPFEYHVLANALDEPSITLHIYGGEMSSCHIFEPAAGGCYLRRDRALAYHD